MEECLHTKEQTSNTLRHATVQEKSAMPDAINVVNTTQGSVEREGNLGYMEAHDFECQDQGMTLEVSQSLK